MFSLPSLSDAPRNAETESRRLASVFYTLTDIQEVNFGHTYCVFDERTPSRRVGDASILKTRTF